MGVDKEGKLLTGELYDFNPMVQLKGTPVVHIHWVWGLSCCWSVVHQENKSQPAIKTKKKNSKISGILVQLHQAVTFNTKQGNCFDISVQLHLANKLNTSSFTKKSMML